MQGRFKTYTRSNENVFFGSKNHKRFFGFRISKTVEKAKPL